MRRALAVIMSCALLATACSSATNGAHDSTPAAPTSLSSAPEPSSTTTGEAMVSPSSSSTTATLPAVGSTTEATTTTQQSTTTSSSTSTASTSSTTVPALPSGPGYVVTRPDGVFRITGGESTLVLDRSDVAWAADDGMGGIIYTAGESIEYLRAEADVPTVLTDNAPPPRFVTLLEGRPSLVFARSRDTGCDDADAWSAVIIDLITGGERIYEACLPLEGIWFGPVTMGGSWSITLGGSGLGSGWPDEEPRSPGLIFRDLDGSEVALSTNPWPEKCRWCWFSPQLSPGGSLLALAEYLPEPSDVGAASWDEFAELGLDEQEARWHDSYIAGEPGMRLRTVDLVSGETRYSAHYFGVGVLHDFDGRYLIYAYGGPGNAALFPSNMHLIDTHTGEEIPIDWGTEDFGLEQHDITLVLPPSSSSE